jgi:hypothetical protein
MCGGMVKYVHRVLRTPSGVCTEVVDACISVLSSTFPPLTYVMHARDALEFGSAVYTIWRSVQAQFDAAVHGAVSETGRTMETVLQMFRALALRMQKLELLYSN